MAWHHPASSDGPEGGVRPQRERVQGGGHARGRREAAQGPRAGEDEGAMAGANEGATPDQHSKLVSG